MDPQFNIFVTTANTDELLARLQTVPEKDPIFLQTPFYSLSLRKFDQDPDFFEKCCSIIQNRGVDINSIDIHNQSALYYAAREGNNALVSFFIKNGINVNHIDNEQQSALFYAAREGHSSTIRILCDNGADVNFIDKSGQTALFYAARQGHYDTISTLIQLGTNVSIKDNTNRTAYSIARSHKRSNVLSLLTQKSAGRLSESKSHTQFCPYNLKVQLMQYKMVPTKNLKSDSWVKVDNEVLSVLTQISQQILSNNSIEN